MDDLHTIDSRTVTVRVIIAVSIVAVLAFAWFGVRWQGGNLLATITQETDPNLIAIAEMATRWAPNDPTAFSLIAAASPDITASISLLENAVRLAPHDYRRRIELGRAYEQDEQFDRAEKQLKIAVELAPAYSSARWHLGNFYLRQEQPERAFTDLKIAAANNVIYRDQVFSLVWDYSNKDAGQLQNIADGRPDLVARLAYFFAARGRADDSLRNWNRLGDQDKVRNAALAKAIALGLFDQRHFPQALEFATQYGAETEAAPETITNGSFEKPIGESEQSRFEWSIARNDPKFEAIPDSRVKREGSRSLRVTFKGYSKPALANIFQTVVVEPSRKYRLKMWIRTENLRSAGMPLAEIVNANDEKSIVRSRAFPSGSNDWEQIEVDFTAPNNCNGISIRTIREFCGEDCPLTGIFWYDDYLISKQ